MNTPDFTLPDPSPWLLALASGQQRDAIVAWREWLTCFVWLTDGEWNQRARDQALDAMQNGRTPRVPCGPHPDRLGRETADCWFEWACKAREERFEPGVWIAFPGRWVRDVMSELGLKGGWRHPHFDAGMTVFILMMRLDLLHRSVGESDAGVRGPADPEGRRKMVWRECVRIRQNLADMVPLAQDLPRGSRRHFKGWWFACLEWTRLAELSGEHLWERQVEYPWTSRAHVAWQRWFGKLAFR